MDVKVFFLQEFVYLGYSEAVHKMSMSYYAWSWSTSLCGWWYGGMVVCKPILVFSFVQAEQLPVLIRPAGKTVVGPSYFPYNV